jgi:ubiquinone biosynthesis protein COQ9
MSRTPADRLAAARDAIVAAVMVDAGEHGWTDEVLERAAGAAGIDGPLAARAFPRGARSLVEEFHRWCDRRMAEGLAAHDLPELRIGQRVALAVRLRIEAMAAPGGDRRAAARAVAFQALPENMASGARSLARTTDTIWRAVGDRSVDFSWYTKRASLGAIYAASVLVWLKDDSEASAETWSFLGRRLRDIATFGKTKARAQSVVQQAATTGFSVARALARGAGAVVRRGPGAFPRRWTAWRGIRSGWLPPSGR